MIWKKKAKLLTLLSQMKKELHRLSEVRKKEKSNIIGFEVRHRRLVKLINDACNLLLEIGV